MKFTSKCLLVWLMCTTGTTHAQRFYAVVFDKLPKDNQLYARADDNTAEIPVSGRVEQSGWDHFSLVTYRNGERIAYQRSMLEYGGKPTAHFSLSATIKAELADYAFEVYACHTGDSSLIVKRSEVVAGDFYVISGQSNAAAGIFGVWGNKYARTIGRIPDNDPAILPGDTLWIQSSWSWPYTGAWGVELQKYILENDSIPTCIINGALPGSKIAAHLDRDASDPGSGTLYGHLYNRIKAAAPTRIRAFFWYQGEQDALENTQDYAEQYDKLFKYWQTDYPQVDQFVVVQIPVLFNPFYTAGTIREFQRRTKYIYPKTEHFNVSGLPGFDGIHYNLEGYQELGRRFYNFLKPRIYPKSDSADVACPDVQKMFFSTEKRDEITIFFEDSQHLVLPKDTLLTDVSGQSFLQGLKDEFFFDGDETKPAGIASGSVAGNKLTLKLNAESTAKKLSYLPAYKGEKVAVFYGPFLKNKNGLAAFSFQELPIADLLIITPFEAKETNAGTVMIAWQSGGSETFILERKTEQDDDYILIDTLSATILSYEDKDVSPDATYHYRIQAFSKASQSEIKTISIKTLPLLLVEYNQDKFWKVYPNPASELLTIDLQNPEAGTITIANAQGKCIRAFAANKERSHKIDLSNLPPGIYILFIKTEKAKPPAGNS